MNPGIHNHCVKVKKPQYRTLIMCAAGFLIFSYLCDIKLIWTTDLGYRTVHISCQGSNSKFDRKTQIGFKTHWKIFQTYTV